MTLVNVTVVSSRLSDSVCRLVGDTTAPSTSVAGVLAVCYGRVWSPAFSLVAALADGQVRSSILSSREGAQECG